MGYAYPIDSKVVTNPNGTIDYDRASSSAQIRGLIKSMITNGVNLAESTNLQVMADEETMNLVVKPGYVIIEGALKHFEEDVKVKIANADASHPRIDTVVVRLNLNEDVRDIVIDVLQGIPSAEPVAPELSQITSTYYELGLADILVEAETEQLSQEAITDTRLLNSRCGMISAIGEIDTETLFVQLTTDFNNWFESIKGQLGDDVAGGLQMQITNHRESTVSSEEGMHGIRYFENALGIYNSKTKKWDNFGIPPRPVSEVTAIVRSFRDGYYEVDASWVLGEVHDSQTKEIHIYGYKREDEPTDFEEFVYQFSVEKGSTSVVAEIDDAYTYILVAPVSTEGVIQKDLSQMCKATMYEDLPRKSITFANATWSEINEISTRGFADYYFSVGDERTIKIGGIDHVVYVAGFGLETTEDGNVAGITIAAKNCLLTQSPMDADYNYTWQGWETSDVRSTLNGSILLTLDEELQSVIKPVKKKFSYTDYETAKLKGTTIDKIWIFSEMEIFGDKTSSNVNDGEHYPCFPTTASKIKFAGDVGTSGVTWWTRSVCNGDYNYYVAVNNNGSKSLCDLNNSAFVCPVFCV